MTGDLGDGLVDLYEGGGGALSLLVRADVWLAKNRTNVIPLSRIEKLVGCNLPNHFADLLGVDGSRGRSWLQMLGLGRL